MSNANLVARAHAMRAGTSDTGLYYELAVALAAAEIEIKRLTKELGSRENSAMSNNGLIARLELAKRSLPNIWRDGSYKETAEVIGEAQTALAAADKQISGVRNELQTWDTPTNMDIEALATAIKSRVVELEHINGENKIRIEAAESYDLIRDREASGEWTKEDITRLIKTKDNLYARIEAADKLNAVLLEALKNIDGGFINSDCLMGDPPNWHSAFSQLQAIARAAIALAEKKS